MKRFFSLFIALMMLVSCLPAFADTAARPDPSSCTHQWEIDPNGKQTCTEGCSAVRYCYNCYTRETITLPALGHDWGAWNTTIPTCTKDGEQDRTCRRCGLYEHTVLPKLGHDYGPWEVTQEPTCTEKGVTATHCQRCGLLWDEDLAPLGHDMGEWYRVKDPTPEAPGLEQRDCVRSDLTEEREIPYIDENPPILSDPEARLVLTGSMGLPNPVPAAGLNMPIFLTVTNTGDFSLSDIRIYVTAQDDNGDKFHFGLENELIFEKLPPYEMGIGDMIDTIYSLYISEHYLDDMPSLYSFTFVATGVTQFGQPVTSNEWTCCPDVYMMDEPFLVSEEVVPAFASPVLGAVVPVTVRVTNTSQYDLSIIGLDSMDLNGMSDNPWYLFFGETVDSVDTDRVHPGESFTHTFEYVITQDDLNAGNLARQVWGNGRVWIEYNNKTYRVPAALSNEQIIVVPFDDSMLTVVKGVTSTSQYPSGYILGEEITYKIVVINHSTTEMTGIEVHDELSNLPNEGYLGTVSVQPGSSASVSFTYTVDEIDVQTGFVSNQAFLVQDSADITYSNIVTVLVGDSLPIPTIEKIETSHPANGEYYQLGETIEYLIHVGNDTQYYFNTVYVSDWLNDVVPPVLLDTITVLAPGDVHEYPFTHEVDQADVERGYVENFATADWAYGDEFNFQVAIIDSNIVISPTNEFVPPIPPAVFTPEPKDGYRPCTLTLEDMGDEGAMYDQYICVDHQPYAVKAAAATPAEARAIWTEALDEMYSKAYDTASNAEVRMALLNEKFTFYGYLAAYETSLKASVNDEQAVDETICQMLKRQCTDLCYLVHTAPDARADSYVGKVSTLSAEVTAVCGSDLYYTSDSDEYFMLNLCSNHSKAHAAMLKILAASDSAHTLNAWQQATRIWNAELQKLGDSAVETPVFETWIRCRNALLMLIYDADTVTEMMAQTIMNRVVELCK